MLSFLDELGKTPHNQAGTFYLTPSLLPNADKLIKKLVNIPLLTEDIIKIITVSKTGAVLFWGEARKCLVIPPFPVKEHIAAKGYNVQPLYQTLETDFRIGIVLIRLGSYAIGFARGNALVSSKVGTGLVHARHRQGGSSAHRFERHRDKQIESFLTRVCGHIREQFEPEAKTIDYIAYGGAWTTILTLKNQCPFLNQFEGRELPPLLTIPEPRQAVLASAVERVWASRVIEYEFPETNN